MIVLMMNLFYYAHNETLTELKKRLQNRGYKTEVSKQTETKCLQVSTKASYISMKRALAATKEVSVRIKTSSINLNDSNISANDIFQNKTDIPQSANDRKVIIEASLVNLYKILIVSQFEKYHHNSPSIVHVIPQTCGDFSAMPLKLPYSLITLLAALAYGAEGNMRNLMTV